MKVLAILLFVLPLMTGFTGASANETPCGCPSVTQLAMTGKTSDSISWSWTGPDGATGYELWFYHHGDIQTSGRFTTSNTAFTFTGLTTGYYTFYIVAICGGETSPFIGVDDILIE